MDQAVHQEDIVTPSSKQKDMDIPIVEQDTIQMASNQTTNDNEKTKYLKKLQNQRCYLKSKLKQNTIQRNTRAIQLKVGFN